MTKPSLTTAMEIAIEESKIGLSEQEFPFGAVVMGPDGGIVSRAHDTVVQHDDPTRHAEIDAVRLAIASMRADTESGSDLSGCTLVCSGEPCSMCSSAAWWSGIRDVVYGVSMVELKELVPDSMSEALGPLEDINKTLNDKFTITSGVMRSEVLRVWDIDA